MALRSFIFLIYTIAAIIHAVLGESGTVNVKILTKPRTSTKPELVYMIFNDFDASKRIYGLKHDLKIAQKINLPVGFITLRSDVKAEPWGNNVKLGQIPSDKEGWIVLILGSCQYVSAKVRYIGNTEEASYILSVQDDKGKVKDIKKKFKEDNNLGKDDDVAVYIVPKNGSKDSTIECINEETMDTYWNYFDITKQDVWIVVLKIPEEIEADVVYFKEIRDEKTDEKFAVKYHEKIGDIKQRFRIEKSIGDDYAVRINAGITIDCNDKDKISHYIRKENIDRQFVTIVVTKIIDVPPVTPKKRRRFRSN